MIELQREAHGDFTGFIRMDPVMFHELLVRLTPRLTKQDTHMRRALEPGLKLAVTLRFLATGNSYRSLAFTFRVPHNTISIFVREVCAAIVDEFGEEVVALPTTEPGWRGISEQFSTRWNFHHTLGAIDGKHIAIKCPPNSGSVFHNYKKFFSVILLGIVDADYRFLWVNMGANGSTSDCAVFNTTDLKTAFENNTIGLPSDDKLPGDDMDTSYFLVAFPQKYYNTTRSVCTTPNIGRKCEWYIYIYCMCVSCLIPLDIIMFLLRSQ